MCRKVMDTRSSGRGVLGWVDDARNGRVQCVGESDGRRDEPTEPGRGYYRIYDMSGGEGGDILVIFLNTLPGFARFNFENELSRNRTRLDVTLSAYTRKSRSVAVEAQTH